MPPISRQPPLAAIDGFLQMVHLIEERHAIGLARWHSPTGSSDGVVQIFDFRIEPVLQRQGHGKRLLAAVVEQCFAFHELPPAATLDRPEPPPPCHRPGIFLSQGFTHIVTAKDLLLATDDLLIYVRTFS